MAGKEALSKEKAKVYSFQKYSLSIFDTFYTLLLLLIFAKSGLSKVLKVFLSGLSQNQFIILPLYLLVIAAAYYFLSFPLNFYHSFSLERKFSLSNQKISDWLKDQLKGGVLSYLIGLILIFVFYFVLRNFHRSWWLIVSLLFIIFNLVFARLVPTLVIPLFFKYKKITDEALRERIINLAKKMKVTILDCFEIDFSKKSLKANAAFVGWGSSRRVLLADTLKDKYTHQEIEAIIAHEFAHYGKRHLFKLIALNSFVTLCLFYIIFLTNDQVLNLFGLSSLWDIASLPVIFIYFLVFGIFMQPVSAYFSRRLEREADLLALKAIGERGPFISMMQKLASQNLADTNPHPLIKFFFFDHPPIDERIKMAESYR